MSRMAIDSLNSFQPHVWDGVDDAVVPTVGRHYSDRSVGLLDVLGTQNVRGVDRISNDPQRPASLTGDICSAPGIAQGCSCR